MMERVEALVKAHVDVIVVDSAHGHSRNILEAVKRSRPLIRICRSLQVTWLPEKQHAT